MQLVPTQDEVIALLRETGALKTGHFEYSDGQHAGEFLQVPLALRNYQHAKTLSVGLSRLLRQNPEIRAIIPQLSIVAPAPNGLPVAYGVCEALHACQVYWASRERADVPLQLPQYLDVKPGEKVLIVDDILRKGQKLNDLRKLLESRGAEVVGIAVIVYQPTPDTPDFSPLPLYYLAKLDAHYYPAADAASLGMPAEKVQI